MDYNSNHIIYLSSGLIGVYTTYRLINVFFKDKTTNRFVETSTYIFYYFFINFLYLYINIPAVTLVGNIICLIILSYNYKTGYKNRFIAIFLIYLILLMVETTVALFTGYLISSIFSSNPEYTYNLGYVFTKIIGFFVVLFIENYNNIKKGFQISTSHWLSILSISFSSLYIIIILVESKIDSVSVSIIISLLFVIIMIIFYLYDGLKGSAEMEIENTVLEQEKKYYIKQFELMKSSVDNTMSLKHDIRNHLGVIGKLINNNENSKALDYINQLEEYTYFNKEYINSGNLVIDSILNYKLDYLKIIGTKIDTKVVLPSDLDLKAFDMVIILGNILDNAVESLNKLHENRMFSLSIKYKNGLLFIYSKNTFDGNIIINNGNLLTSKKDKQNHGFGLKNVQSALEKYNGIIKYNYTDTIFMVDILMYIS